MGVFDPLRQANPRPVRPIRARALFRLPLRVRLTHPHPPAARAAALPAILPPDMAGLRTGIATSLGGAGGIADTPLVQWID